MAQKQQEKNIKILSEVYNENDLVTCWDDGSPINPATFSQYFGRILKKNSLLKIRFHDLRHTNTILILKQKVSAKVASERLGHSNIGIILDLYSHVLKEMQEEAAGKLDEVIFFSKKESE